MVKCREEGKGLIKREERRRGRDMVGSSLFNLPFCRALDSWAAIVGTEN